MMDVHDVENFIRYEFNDKALLAAAFIPSKNGRLGFLGDKVIGLILLDDWYRTSTNCCECPPRPCEFLLRR
jgi:dsRNA-specific ribonuclease